MADGGETPRRSGPAIQPLRALDLGELPETLGFRLRLAQQVAFRDFGTQFSAFDISPLLYSALLLIERNPGCRQTDIAIALGVRQPNLVERIDALVERKLISRNPDPEDRRANVLVLTAAGKRLMPELHAAHAEHRRRLVAVLGEDNYRKAVQLLEKLQ